MQGFVISALFIKMSTLNLVKEMLLYGQGNKKGKHLPQLLQW